MIYFIIILSGRGYPIGETVVRQWVGIGTNEMISQIHEEGRILVSRGECI